MTENNNLVTNLELLRHRHNYLDRKIRELTREPHPNQILVIKLKKEKLRLKDRITQLESQIYPDIIA